MIKKDKKGNVNNLKTLRLLVEVVDGENGVNYVIRTEQGTPIAHAVGIDSFLTDVKNICTDFENFNPDNHGNEEN